VTGAAPSLLATNQVAGWCNGPAGFVPLFALAAAQGIGEGLDRVADRAAWSSWEAPSEVFDLCCGLVGRAYGLLGYYRMSGDPAWLHRAEELGRRAITRFRSARAGLPRPLSLFKGEAGVALLAADLQSPDRARFPFYEPEGFPPRLRDGKPA
jgi:serine/threonine-protein kinase